MKLYEQIIDNRNKFRTTVGKQLNTLIGEIQRADKNFKGGDSYIPDDEIVIRTIKKFIESAKIIIEKSTNDDMKLEAQAEIDILSEYLPKQLTDQDLEKFAKDETLILPTYMKFLKENYTGRYDGKLASEIWKRVRG